MYMQIDRIVLVAHYRPHCTCTSLDGVKHNQVSLILLGRVTEKLCVETPLWDTPRLYTPQYWSTLDMPEHTTRRQSDTITCKGYEWSTLPLRRNYGRLRALGRRPAAGQAAGAPRPPAHAPWSPAAPPASRRRGCRVTLRACAPPVAPRSGGAPSRRLEVAASLHRAGAAPPTG